MIRLAFHQLNNLRHKQSPLLPSSSIITSNAFILHLLLLFLFLLVVLFTLDQGAHEALHLSYLRLIQQINLIHSLPLLLHISQINFLQHLPKLR